MPATAGRVRMPANNRVHSSAALQTHDIWQTAIQYDPYAPKKNDFKNSSLEKPSNAYPESENAYASFQGLLALARISGNNADEVRGTCKKCGRVGHLTFQCRNFLSVKEDSDKDKDTEAIRAVVLLDKIKGNVKRAVQSEEEENESETSDSEMDSEIEGIIAERYGKKTISKGKSSKKFSDEDRLDSDSEKRKRIGKSKNRSRKRTTSNAEYEGEGQRKRRKDKRRRRDESSDEEEGRKRKSRKEKRRIHR